MQPRQKTLAWPEGRFILDCLREGAAVAHPTTTTAGKHAPPPPSQSASLLIATGAATHH